MGARAWIGSLAWHRAVFWSINYSALTNSLGALLLHSSLLLVALCALVLELWRGWREHERGEVRDVTSHLDLHAAPTAWRLVHGSWAHWRRAEEQGKAPVGLGRGANVSPFFGGRHISTGHGGHVLAVGELEEGTPEIPQALEVDLLFRGETVTRLGSVQFGLWMRKPDISVVSWQEGGCHVGTGYLKGYVVMVMMQEEG